MIDIKQIISKRKFLESTCLVALLVMFYIIMFLVGTNIEQKAYDVMTKVYIKFTATEKSKPDNRIIMVLIDNESIEKVGRWPWPRTKYIELFDYLKNVGKAKVITFDSIIQGPDTWNPDSDQEFFKQLSNYDNLQIGLELIETPRLKNVITEDTYLDKFSLKHVTDHRLEQKNTGEYGLRSSLMKDVVENVSGMGSVLSNPHNDQKIRTIAHIFPYHGKYLPSLSLGSVLAYFETPDPKIDIYETKTIIHLPETDIVIPTENFPLPYIDVKDKPDNLLSSIQSFFYKKRNFKYYNKAWIKWYEPRNYQSYSHNAVSAYELIEALEDIKEGKQPALNPLLFKDKIAVIGATAQGINTTGAIDIKSTPLFIEHPGVDIQATSIDNLLNSDFFQNVPFNTKIYVFILIALLIIIIMMRFENVYFAILTVLCIAFTYFFVVMYYVYPQNMFIELVTPIICIILTPMIVYTYRFFIEARKRDELTVVLGKMVSSDVMNELLKDPNKAELSGKRTEVTILFSDIRGFTQLSEQFPPEEITQKLKIYFNAMEPIIHQYDGTLDKFMGDGIMAIFGAPVHHEQHAYKAVQAAFDMQQKLTELNQKWEKKNEPRLDMGIGINTGICFVGQLGSDRRIQYTAIGDTVNLASRLEQLNKQFNTKIIVSQSTYEAIRKDVEVRALKKENIRGRSEPVMVYELLGIRNLKDFLIKAEVRK